ncbi:MAG TPA: hypothetical protein VMU01_12500 [Rhizomicrobium sp.]|nr:hypothetical protein [Rhizomicrobium sp.]
MRTLMITCALALLCGCASEPKPPVVTTAYEGLPLVTASHPRPPDFSAVTWTRTMMMNAPAGGREEVAEGNDLVAEFGVPDPARAISAALASALSSSLKTVPADASADGSGLVLDVVTDGWAFTYIGSDPAHYQVKYMGRARLLHAADNGEIAAVPCRWESNLKDAPTYDDLLAGRGALLKDMLASAAADCAVAYHKQLLLAPALQQPAAPER